MSLRREVGQGLFWVAVATLAARGIAMLNKFILARLLVPADFGLVSYATLAIGVLELFKELGFGSALIYRQEEVDASTVSAADTTFLAILGSSTILYGLGYLVAPLIARFFRTDALVPVLRTLSLTLVISSVSQVPLTLMAKGMGFKKKVLPEMLAVFAGSAVSVVLALLRYGVWSMVIGQIVTASLLSVLVWFFCPWRPRFAFSLRVARELWQYGKHIIGSQIMVFLITNTDDAFVGRFLGSAALGTYGFAYDMSNVPATHLSRIVSQVLFPAFSKVQGDLAKLRQAFFKSFKYVSLIAFPVSIITMGFARDFVYVAFGRKWAGAILPLQWLTVYGLARAIAVNMGNVFKAGGRPRWLFNIAAVRLTVMLALLYPATIRFGITGVAALSAVVAVLDFVLSLVVTNRILHASWASYLRVLVPMLIVSVATSAVAHEIYLRIDQVIHPFVALPLMGGLALGAYLGAMYAYDPEIRITTQQFVSAAWVELRRLRPVPGVVRQ